MLDAGEPLLVSVKQRLIAHFSDGINAVPSNDGAVKIVLTFGDAPVDMVDADHDYSIKAVENTVTVTGFGAAGLFYGVVMLCQLLKVEYNLISLPAIEILERPDLRTRAYGGVTLRF